MFKGITGFSLAAPLTFSFSTWFYRQVYHFIIVKLFFKVLTVGKKIKELVGLFVWVFNTLSQIIVTHLLFKIMFAGASSFDLNKVSWGKYRAKQAKVKNVGAIVPCSHHANGDTNTSFAGFVGIYEIGGSQ